MHDTVEGYGRRTGREDEGVSAEGIRIINLTSHSIRLGFSAEVMRSEGQARVNSQMREVGSVFIDGPPPAEIPILEIVEGDVDRLPAPREGVLYVVSGIVAAAAMRNDVLTPARVERGQRGEVVACHALARPIPRRQRGDDASSSS